MEDLWKIYDTENEWIRYSDTKSNLIITVYGVVLTLIYSNANSVYIEITKSNTLFILSILSIILAIMSFYYAVKCISPILNLNKSKTKVKSIIYFGGITNLTKEDFKNSIKVKGNIENELIDQIYINANIANSKFVNVKKSIQFFALTIILTFIMLIFYLIKQ